MSGRLRRLPPLALALLALAVLAPAPAAAAAPPRVAARTALLMDAATGAVLWQRGGHQPTLVASTTKALTALVAEEAYPRNQLLTVPLAAERVDGTRFGYRTGMRVRLEALLTTLLLVSANDAAETLAAAYPQGGRAGFLRAMQSKAAALGCTDSTWRDPSGLDAPGHRASAADLALIGRAVLRRPYLAALARTGTISYRWPDGRLQVLTNHNRFVSDGRDPGALGVKTGYTSKARSTIVAAQRRGNRTLVAVALGSPDMYADIRSMLAYGFATPARSGLELLGPPPRPARPRPEFGAEAFSATGLVGGGQPAEPAAGSRASLPSRVHARVLAHPLRLAAFGALGLLLLGLALVLLGHHRHGEPPHPPRL